MVYVVVNGKTVVRRASRKARIAPEVVFGKPAPSQPNRFAGRCVAVTSISPNPARMARQQRCIASWRNLGVPVVAVNASHEVARLRCRFPGVDFTVCDDLTTEYDRPTQRVSSLISAGISEGLPFFLVNSDIEIYQAPQSIMDAIETIDGLTIGVRHNHEPGQRLSEAHRERSGLDCFLLTAEMAGTLPALPFGVGKPGWDYWLPHHFRSLGHRLNWMDEPLLFHERHQLGWSHSDWELGAGWLKAHYGISLGYGSAAFRRSLDRVEVAS